MPLFAFGIKVANFADGTKVGWVNLLPDAASNITSVEKFIEIAEAEKVHFPTTLTTRIVDNQMMVVASLDLKDADTSWICFGNTLSLTLAEFYIKYLNTWFFANRKEWDPNLRVSLEQLRYLYIVELRNGDISIEIQGKLVMGSYGIPRIEILSPLFINIPDVEPVPLRGSGIERSLSGYPYMTLGIPYNPLTQEYFAPYAVYKLFNRKDKLEGIPTPQH